MVNFLLVLVRSYQFRHYFVKIFKLSILSAQASKLLGQVNYVLSLCFQRVPTRCQWMSLFSSLILKGMYNFLKDFFFFFFSSHNHIFYFINQRGRFGLEIESSCNDYLLKMSKYNGIWCQGTIGWPLKSPKSEGGQV